MALGEGCRDVSPGDKLIHPQKTGGSPDSGQSGETSVLAHPKAPSSSPSPATPLKLLSTCP